MDRLKGNVDGEGGQMTFLDHLLELRWRLIMSLLTVVVCVMMSLVFYKEMFDFMRGPLDGLNASLPADAPKVELASWDPMDTLVLVMWMSIGAGLIISSPIIIYQVWAFVAPGLRQREKRAIQPVLWGGMLFFLSGCALGYYLLFPVAIKFFGALNVELHVKSQWTVHKYSTLLLNMMLLAGLICETPLVVAAFSKLGILKPEHLTRFWRACLLVAFGLGAVLSPGTDVLSMLLFSGLLVTLYLVSILAAHIFYPRKPAAPEPKADE
jgi:sec-independent protein translocase protein TatC